MNISFILGGILLGISILDKWDKQKDFFRKIEYKLLPYKTLIGGTMILLGITSTLSGSRCIIVNLISICAGILLSYSYLIKIESIKSYIIKLSDTISPFKAFLGIGLMVLGILRIFNIYILC